MSGAIYPKVRALVPGILRSLSSIVLILIAAACVYLSFAVMEAPREYWWTYWTIYAFVGLSCLLAAGWLLRRSLTSECFRRELGERIEYLLDQAVVDV